MKLKIQKSFHKSRLLVSKNLFAFILLTLIIVSCKSPEARMPESVKTGSFLQESVIRNKKLNEKEQKQIKNIIKNNPNNDYIASKSGFWYYYNHKIENDTIQPNFGDVIDFDFNVSNIEGQKIYPKESRTYVMDKEELFTGLREGLKLMKPNEEVTFIFPSNKAFGYYGDDHKIGVNIPLICEVKLKTITQNND